MSNPISNELLAEFYGQESSDPLLMLLTLSHSSFSTIRLVNNTVDIVSNGNTFTAFPFKFVLPPDDGESVKQLRLTIDNVGLDLVDELRTVTTPITCVIEAVLASNTDTVQFSYENMKLTAITYNKTQISASVVMDDFLSAKVIDESYTPTNYPGLF